MSRRMAQRRPLAVVLAVAVAVGAAAVLGRSALGFVGARRAGPPAVPAVGCRAASVQAPASVGAECPLTGRPTDELRDDFTQLLQEIVEIAGSTGAQTGASRALQAAQAASFLLAEVAREPPKELNDAFYAKMLRILFERLGATYIKLGQFIASSPTVFPPDYVREFQLCLDNSVKVSFTEVREIIEGEFGLPLGALFSYLDPVPLASASIAQVHAARLVTGEEVVVKVQKPGIKEVLSTDLGFVYIAARVLGFINPELNTRGSLSDIASDLRTSMLGELDFKEEARNLVVFREFIEENGLENSVTVPVPVSDLVSTKVLTMSRLRGVPLVDLEGIKRYTSDPEMTLVAALNTWALSVQKCEFFHADVHAGNLLVLEDGRVGFLDFGIVGRLPPAVSQGVDMLNVALAEQDPRGMARALMSMGATVGEVDEESFAEDISKLLARLGNATADAVEGGGASSVDESQIQDLVLDIAQVAGNNGLKLPREFGLLIKQALYFDRYTKLLAPDLDMMSDSRIASLGGAAPSEDLAAREVVVDVLEN